MKQTGQPGLKYVTMFSTSKHSVIQDHRVGQNYFYLDSKLSKRAQVFTYTHVVPPLFSLPRPAPSAFSVKNSARSLGSGGKGGEGAREPNTTAAGGWHFSSQTLTSQEFSMGICLVWNFGAALRNHSHTSPPSPPEQTRYVKSVKSSEEGCTQISVKTGIFKQSELHA